MEQKNKELYPGLGLVTLEIAKRLKKFGWIWDTPAILRVRTGEIWEPNKYIDCNVGSDFLFLPSICQVIHWLELWGIKINYSLCKNDKGILYTSPEICTKELLSIKPLYGSEWQSMNEMMLEVIPHALDFLAKILKEYHWGEVNGIRAFYYTQAKIYYQMLQEGNIVETEFYSFFKEP